MTITYHHVVNFFFIKNILLYVSSNFSIYYIPRNTNQPAETYLPISGQYYSQTIASQLICTANQLSDFYTLHEKCPYSE